MRIRSYPQFVSYYPDVFQKTRCGLKFILTADKTVTNVNIIRTYRTQWQCTWRVRQPNYLQVESL